MTQGYLRDLDALEREIRRRGWDRPLVGRTLAELSVHVLVMIAGGALYFATPHLWLDAAGVLLCALGSFGVATNTHTSTHGAASRRRGLDAALSYVGYPLLLGFSATFWHRKHVVLHHRAPNLLGVDDDIDLMPLFAIVEGQRERGGALARAWYSIQWAALPGAIGLNAINMGRQGLLFVGRELLSPRRRWSHVLDAGALVAHALSWVALVVAGLPPADVALLFLLRLALLGYLFFAAFAPAHLPHEAACHERRANGRDSYVRGVVESTINFRTGWLGRFLCSGLGYQIEHHLFPRVHHVHYPAMSRLLSAYCRAHGLPYRSVGWFEGIAKSLLVFVRPKPIVGIESGEVLS